MMMNKDIYKYVSKKICQNDECFCKIQKYKLFIDSIKKNNYSGNDQYIFKEMLELYQKSNKQCKYTYVMMRTDNFIKNLDINENEAGFYIEYYFDKILKLYMIDKEFYHSLLLEKKWVVNYLFIKLLDGSLQIEFNKIYNGCGNRKYNDYFKIVKKITILMLYYFDYTYVVNVIDIYEIEIPHHSRYLLNKKQTFFHILFNSISLTEYIETNYMNIYFIKDIFNNFKKDYRMDIYRNCKKFYTKCKILSKNQQLEYVICYLENKEYKNYQDPLKYTYIIEYIRDNRIKIKLNKITCLLVYNFSSFHNSDKQYLNHFSQKKIIINVLNSYFTRRNDGSFIIYYTGNATFKSYQKEIINNKCDIYYYLTTLIILIESKRRKWLKCDNEIKILFDKIICFCEIHKCGDKTIKQINEYKNKVFE